MSKKSVSQTSKANETLKSVLSCKNLSKVFKTRGFVKSKSLHALKGVSFDLPQGVVCGLLGPNGSGKSTLLKLMTGLIRPTEGFVSFFNSQAFNDVSAKVGFVPEKPEYPGHFSAFEILRLHGELLCLNKNEVHGALEKVGLSHSAHRPFGEFSKGMKQRLGIAKAMLSDPDLVLLDEPLSGLDPDGREALIQVIEDYAKKEEKTVLLSSHLLEDVQRICNYLLVLKQGELVFQGHPFSAIETKSYVLNFKQKEGQIKTIFSDVDHLISSLQENFKEEDLKLLSIQPERQPLSELYFNFINKKNQDQNQNKKE